ncbi:MAG: YceI family protein [Thiobacillaceae bacterium]
MKRTLAGLVLVATSLGAWAAPETYKIDDAHSFANWGIRHIVGRTTGMFTDIKGTLMLDPANPNSGSADVTISVFSIDSGHRERDIHVLTGDFLDAHQYPNMRFVSTGFRSTGTDAGVMTGHLTLHGATRSVDIPYKILGFSPDPWGNQRAAFEGKFTINRSDYGITKFLDSSGGGLLGNEIDITLLVEGLKLGPDGQVLKIRNEPAPAPAAKPAAQPQPSDKEKPDLRDLLKGIFN